MKFFNLCIFGVLLLAAGCSMPLKTAAPAATPAEVVALADSIRSLGSHIDPLEATNAAQIAFDHAQHLAVQYQITDSLLIRITKINLGLRSRGLCWHWARDMQARLKQSEFETLDLHMARSKPKTFRIGHSTLIISAKGDKYTSGIVLDPWRYGGRVFWSATKADPQYVWLLETEVLGSQSKLTQKACALPIKARATKRDTITSNAKKCRGK